MSIANNLKNDFFKTAWTEHTSYTRKQCLRHSFVLVLTEYDILLPHFGLEPTRCHFRSRPAPTAKKFARFGASKFKVIAAFWRSRFSVCRRLSVSHYASMSRKTRRRSSFPHECLEMEYFLIISVEFECCSAINENKTTHKFCFINKLKIDLDYVNSSNVRYNCN